MVRESRPQMMFWHKIKTVNWNAELQQRVKMPSKYISLLSMLFLNPVFALQYFLPIKPYLAEDCGLNLILIFLL